MQVLNDKEPCSPYNQSFANTLDAIQAANVTYHPFSTNSNATATTLLIKAGLNPGTPPPGVYAPGWGSVLLP
jgi:hypothetical protein